MTQYQMVLILKYRATGRVVFIYPRKGTMSINGKSQVKISEGIKQIKEFFSC